MHPITKASLNLTRACNLACDYCFTHGCVPGYRMSYSTAEKAVDFLISEASPLSGTDREVHISFWGGEPLVEWPLLKHIVLYAEEKGAQAVVPVSFGGTTNGTLFTQEKFGFLQQHRIHLVVSFDGTPETHNWYRKFRVDGRGSHEVVEKNIRAALRIWPNLPVRMGPFPERIDHFYDDCRYIFELGVNKLIFSPVYEANWTEESWVTLEEQGKKVVDLLVELKQRGRNVEVQHFRSYQGTDNSKYPCGAGRFYVGIDVDGAIYPCHRFNKFDDLRPWEEKELCIGHIERGITRPEFRAKFIEDWKPKACAGKDCFLFSPCHGGCYAANFDLTGDMLQASENQCRYAQAQMKISEYLKIRFRETFVRAQSQEYQFLMKLLLDLHNRVSKLEEHGNP